MLVVHKYTAQDTREMPVGAQVIHAAQNNGKHLIWAIIDTTAKMEPVQFSTVGTGRPIPDGASYVHTIQDGPYVWHLFKLKKD